jgi:transposase
MGRSRGGLTTKVHALVDANGLPLELVLTPGQAGDCPVAAQLLGHLRENTIVLADKADDADWLRRQIEAAGAAPNIPPMVHRRWSTAAGNLASARCSIGRATASSASSTASNTFDASPRATKSMPQISSPCLSWLPFTFGCAIMSL